MVSVLHNLVYKCRNCRILFYAQESATHEQIKEALAAACCSSDFGKSNDGKVSLTLRYFHSCTDEIFGIGDLQRVDQLEP